MRIGDLVRFNDERFFDGAVQLRWVQERPEKARDAATAFVFHGPRYHGGSDAAQEGLEEHHRLKDSASVVTDLVESILAGLRGEERNPFWLAVAGYGAGKSHLASALAALFEAPRADPAQQIIANVRRADEQIGASLEEGLEQLDKPALVLCLDGMAGFHLGTALTQATYARLHQHGVDASAIRELSPRFQTAEQFVERNFAIRQDAFAQRLPGKDAETICEALRMNDESVYTEVDALYTEANGTPIPVTGQESVQDLLQTLCDVYCGPQGSFSSVILLFDELGRYLEYAAEKPQLAGDAALQQLFQGVQDNPDKVRFIGLIQYELKAYLRRFSNTNMQQLLRYVTRFDTAEKLYLSTNLETIFAHIIGKDETALDQIWEQSNAAERCQTSWQRLAGTLPNISHYPVWNDAQRFNQVIARGCWPLHPLATWFLTRQRDVVQSRSAMTFIKETINEVSTEAAFSGQQLRQVSAAELLLRRLLPEVIAAEQRTGSVVAETLQSLLERLRSHLSEEEQLVLAGIAVLEKMRIGRQPRETFDQLLNEATTLSREALHSAIHRLTAELGAMEWNDDLGQYELIADATTRGQFQQWLRQRQSEASAEEIANLFRARGITECDLDDIEPDFAPKNDIRTPDWRFKAETATADSIHTALANAFSAWLKAPLQPREAKGRVIYLYIHPEDDLAALNQQIDKCFSEQLKKSGYASAPIWIVGIFDSTEGIAEHLWRIHLFDERLSAEERERYRRFIADERERSHQALKEKVRDALKERRYWIAGLKEIPQGRLKSVGEQIFTHIYPATPPFPFDGFASANGGGASDALQLTRNLITGQVDGAWLQSQPKRLQNRVKALLVHSWQALKSSGELTEPQNPKLRGIFEQLKQAHQDHPERTLWHSYQELIAPPYGMNGSSASVLLGLLIADTHPPRRIEMKGTITAAGEWVTAACPQQQGQYHLRPDTLKQTTLRFLTEDAEGRWRSFLAQWDAAQNYQSLVEHAREAEQWHRVEPLPESLEGRYDYLKDRSQKAAEILTKRQNEIDKWEGELERAVRQNQVSEMLRLGSLFLRTAKEMEESPHWPNEPYVSNCHTLLAYARSVIGEHIAEWIPRQSCHNAAEVSTFRNRMDKAVKSLHQLGFQNEATTLENHAQNIVFRVEQRQAYQLTLAQSDDYPRQPEPSSATPAREITDQIQHGNELIEALKKADKVLQESEINARVNAIKQRQEKLKQTLDAQKRQLNELFALQIDSEQTLHEALSQAQRLDELFYATRDHEDIREIALQLSRIAADISAWETDDIPPERLAELLKQQIAEQHSRLASDLEKRDIEPVWDLFAIYNSLADERIESAHKRSTDWLRPRLATAKGIDQADAATCASLERELANAPGYLSAADREQILQLLEAVQQRQATLAEERRAQRVADWLAGLPQPHEIDDFDQHRTAELLRQLNNPPEQLNPSEHARLQPLIDRTTAHYDQQSMDEIINRVMQLSAERQRELLARLSAELGG